MGVAEFIETIWLNINDRFLQYVLSNVYEFFLTMYIHATSMRFFPPKPCEVNKRIEKRFAQCIV